MKFLSADKTTPLFRKLKILKVEDLSTHEIAKIFHQNTLENYQFALTIILHIFQLFKPIPRKIHPLIAIFSTLLFQ